MVIITKLHANLADFIRQEEFVQLGAHELGKSIPDARADVVEAPVRRLGLVVPHCPLEVETVLQAGLEERYQGISSRRLLPTWKIYKNSTPACAYVLLVSRRSPAYSTATPPFKVSWDWWCEFRVWGDPFRHPKPSRTENRKTLEHEIHDRLLRTALAEGSSLFWALQSHKC